jgi:hypothetical protein
MTSRLRLVLRQPDGGLAVSGPDADGLQEVDLVAFASHGRLSGRIRLDRARLSDMLNEHDEFQLEGVLATRLPEGQSRVIRELVITRPELYLVHAGGPRGDRAQRTPTVARAITARCGPYFVTGDVHSRRGSIRPLLPATMMVPLTDAVVSIAVPGSIRGGRASSPIAIVDWVRRTATVTPPGPAGRTRFDRASAGRDRSGRPQPAPAQGFRPQAACHRGTRRLRPDPRATRRPPPASASDRPSSPGRIARCSWPTSAPTSSRSSRRRATRPAAGGRPGSGTRPPGPGRPPTSWPSTATSEACGSTSGPRPGGVNDSWPDPRTSGPAASRDSASPTPRSPS